MRKVTSITITHTIEVDTCIAEEIKELNNVHGIITEFCCCGHGGQGFIIVRDSDIKRMEKLGYKRHGRRYVFMYYKTLKREYYSGQSQQDQFKPKSRCHCHKSDHRPTLRDIEDMRKEPYD